MPDSIAFDFDYLWDSMSDMEKTVWASTFALSGGDPAKGVAVANEAVGRLRLVAVDIEGRPEPEYEAGRAGPHIEWEDFAVWYRISMLVRHGRERDYKTPTMEEIAEAYKRFQMSRNDFY